MPEPIRLSKRVAELRACSRREAEQIIVDGGVKVDGVVIEEPQFRVSDQRIEIAPVAEADEADPVTLLLHKPPGMDARADVKSALALLAPSNAWLEDASGIRPLKKHFSGLTALVPLERDAGGLLVFTHDWRVARKLSEEVATLEHEVIVEVSGDFIPQGLKRLNRGIAYNGRTPPTIKVSWQNETRLRVALKGAELGQIAHLCEAVGLQVVSMKRIRLGGVSMGKLPPSQWRYLRQDERF